MCRRGLTPVVVAITFVIVTTRTTPKPTADELRDALMEHGGSVTQTAAGFEVHRVTIHKWMREYGIEVRRVVDRAA
jgi:transcriptional regulator of acetoin/glycerol metabolism